MHVFNIQLHHTSSITLKLRIGFRKKLNISSKNSASAISIIGAFPGDDKKSNYRNIDTFLNNLIKYARLSKVDCIITDARNYYGKVSFAEMIEKKVQENPFYSNDYKNTINLIGVSSLELLAYNENFVRHIFLI
jgi:hypothetical protein